MSLSHEKPNLRDVVITAVRHGYCKVVEEAVKRSNKFEKEYNRFPPSPDDLLDFCHMLHYSPLMCACENNNLEMVDVLLESNASVAFTNQDGLNALHVACEKGNPSIVKALLQASAKQDKFSKRKGLPSDLHIALNARTNKDGWCPLFFAVKEGHVKIVRCLQEKELASIQQHHILTIPLCIQVASKKKQNVLHIAARKQRLDCLMELHQYIPPASPDADSLYLAVDKRAWNVLHHACAGGSLEVLKWLIETFPGLNTEDFLNAKTMPGYTPLLIACRHQKTDIVKYFAGIDGVDFSACCESSRNNEDGQKGITGLHLAAIHDSPEIARLLIEKKCPVLTQNEKSETALHVAVRKASLDVTDILRKAPGGESLEQIKNKDGDIPSAIQPEEVIPAEIKKRGEGAVELYRKALREGKKKIPRCNLLVLGEERVGKTSLIRLLTGKRFIPDLCPTRGIDNRVVDTVDTRAISTVKWEEVKQDDQARENDDRFATGVVEVMGPLEPLNQHKQGEKEADKAVSPKELLKEIDQIFSEMERVQKPIYSPAHAAPRLHPDVAVQQHVPEVPQETYTRPQPTPPTTAGVPKEDTPETYSSEPQPDVAIEPPLESHESTMHEADSFQSQKSPRQVDSTLSRRHAQLIDQKLKSTSQGVKEPTLHLKTYDFAGQKEYRPMHHCFITRRSIYIVVFNLQKLLASSDEKERNESLNQIQYWLNSILAHIYTEDDKTRQIFLVGTHRSPKNREQGKSITEDELKNIHEMLFESTYCCEHSRFTNHLRFHNDRIFAAIESSYDDPDEREASGVEYLQHALQEASKDLKFLSNEYPLTWLRFETQLMQMREERQQGKASQMVELPRVLYRAQRCGILDQKHIDLALQFFHDTGTIILLRELPTLFLGESEKDQLANLVLLDPKWLITLMKIVMELKHGDRRFPGKDLVALKKTGIASSALLQTSWKDHFPFKKLCLMLQAYCLIFPIRDMAGSPNQSQSDDHEADITEFLVPSMLPDLKLEDISCCNYTFYFDFRGFLPAEVFHRFVCLMLARMSPTCKDTKQKRKLSANCCQFYEVEGSHWQLEKVETGHVLQVSVVPPQKKQPPHYYISMIHREFLKKICNESDLKGLVYSGGPKVACQMSKCAWSGILAYVQYPNDSSEVKCPKCNKEYKECDIDEMLQEQRMSDIRPSPTSQRMLEGVLSYNGKKPNMVNLQGFKTKSGKKVKVSERIGTNYRDFGLQLLNDESGQIVDAIIEQKHEKADKINYEILKRWVNGEGKPRSWETLIEVLEDCELGTLAQEIKNELTTST